MADKPIEPSTRSAAQPATGMSRTIELPDDIQALAPPTWFVPRCADAGIELEDGDLHQFGHYLALLQAANQIMNLTTVRDPDAAWEKHIFDSMTLLPLLASMKAMRVVDVGSGGGVPGIPLAIALPSVSFTLVESTGKKAQFLEQAAMRLGVANVTVVTQRAEDVGRVRAVHREKYDAALVRAVGHLAVVSELCVPLVRVGGFVLAVKGAKATDEIEQANQALHLLHAAVADTVETPTGRVVVLEKLRATPKLYPRRAGEPKRSPLGMRKKE